jgi:hypothetical protein
MRFLRRVGLWLCDLIVMLDRPPPREPIEHQLKTWPDQFQAMLEGRKRFDMRSADRDFREGDTLLLEEYDPKVKFHTGRWMRARVTYVLNPLEFGYLLGNDVRVMSTNIIEVHGDGPSEVDRAA